MVEHTALDMYNLTAAHSEDNPCFPLSSDNKNRVKVRPGGIGSNTDCLFQLDIALIQSTVLPKTQNRFSKQDDLSGVN